MAECFECGDDFSDKRKALGYDVCLKCGDIHAHQQAVSKSKQVAPAYNKGPYMFINTLEDAKTAGRKV